jgi:hypothetical protein
MKQPETIKIDDIEYIRKDSISQTQTVLVNGLKPVLVRSYGAGVHIGFLKEEKFTQAGKVVILINTRRIFYWDGAASISQMALEGVNKVKNCKFSVVLAENEIVNVIETIPLTDKAFKNLYEVPVWKM